MNRGKTALKRGVAVASVAAMAIAGAVLAAPAASALPIAGSYARALPVANANQIGADGNALPNGGTAPGAPTYSTVTTGNVPTIQAGVKSQRVSDLQIEIPSPSPAGVMWAAADKIQVALPTGVTFNGTPTVSVSPNVVDLATITTLQSPSALSPAVPVANYNKASGTPSVSAGAGLLTLSTSADISSTDATATHGIIVTVSGIYVDVADTFGTTYGAGVGNNAVTAVVSNLTGPVAMGTTTLGYVNSFSVTAAGTYPANAKTVSLPDITINELSKAGFVATQNVTLSLTTDPVASPAATFDTTVNASVTASGSTTIAAGTSVTPTSNTVTVSPSAADPAQLESVTLSGLVVKGVPAGAKVVLTVSAPTGNASNSAAPSYTPSQTTYASVSVASAVAPPRIAGTSRYDTAAQIAAAGSSSWSNKAVILANGTDVKNGVDALAANFLAGAKTAPILLTDSSNSLPVPTQLALTRLFSGQTGNLTIYVFGKTDAVSQAAQDSALAIAKAAANSSATVTIKSIAGNDRYATDAAAVTEAASAIKSYNLGSGALKTAFLASGTVNADALAAGGFSAGAGIPVLLVADGAKALSTDVANVITTQHIGQVIVLGGPDRVSADVVTQLGTLGVTNVVRKAGSDRFATAADLNTMAFTAATNGLGLALSNSTAYLANGLDGWPDALTVGPLAGLQTAPLLTVSVNQLPSGAQAFLSTNKGNIGAIEALGAKDRIADAVITAAQQAIQ